MAEEVESTDISQQPEILRLAEDVARSGLARVLRRNGDVLAVLRPAPAKQRRTAKPRTSSNPNAWLEGLIGIGQSDGPTDVSADIHRYVADVTRAE